MGLPSLATSGSICSSACEATRASVGAATPAIGATASGPAKTGDLARGGGSNHDLLQKLATFIKPSGVVQFGGPPMLLFHEKKLKVGDNLKITVEGVDYSVTISAIDQTSFKIRLNGEEVTRPIKPGKVP